MKDDPVTPDPNEKEDDIFYTHFVILRFAFFRTTFVMKVRTSLDGFFVFHLSKTQY